MDKQPGKGGGPDMGGDKKMAGGGKGSAPVDAKRVDKTKEGLSKPAAGDMKKPGGDKK